MRLKHMTNLLPGIYSRPTLPSFHGRGLYGYTFGPLKQRDLEIYYVEVQKGHDTFMVSKKITRTYYVCEGSGYFTIGGVRYDVSAGMLIEVPPQQEYSYSGQMTLLTLSIPRWYSGNDTHTKWNPAVVTRDRYDIPPATRLSRVARLRFLGKSPVGAVLRLTRHVWPHLPAWVAALRPVRGCGNMLHHLARLHDSRKQASSTYFLRNRPELELIRRIADRRAYGESLRVAVLGCSSGPEAYSIAWTIRSARSDLKMSMQAVDISSDAIEYAVHGTYSLNESGFGATTVCERMTQGEIEGMFDRSGDRVTIKPWIREAIQWRVDDCGEPELIAAIGLQDIVVASNFLCHMEAHEAERCLRNIARLVRPGGHLFISGVDLDVRTKVARELGWGPVDDLIQEIHEGDPCLLGFWPWHYGGLEPINKKRYDWKLRYASAFQVGSEPVAGERENELAASVR